MNQAKFWSAVQDKPVMEGATEDFAAIGLQDPPNLRPHWMFIKVPEGKVDKNRFHARSDFRRPGSRSESGHRLT
jgi:hypothetical protein